MAAPVIFAGNYSKFLKSIIDLNGNGKILAGNVNPSAVATSAPKGSIYLNNSNGFLYRKTDAGSSTNWVNVYKVSPPALATTSKSADYTATTSDDLIEYDISGASRTLTLYSASGNAGRQLIVKLTTTASTNTLTVTDGSFSKKMVTVNECLILYSNGTAWKVKNHYIPRTMATTTTTWNIGTKGTVVNDKITWWREERFMVGTFDYGQSTGGTAGTGNYQATVPGSWSIDTTNLSAPASANGIASMVGDGVMGNDTVGLGNSFVAEMHVWDSTHLFFRKMNNSQSVRVTWANTDASIAFNSSQLYLTFDFILPITNWDY